MKHKGQAVWLQQWGSIRLSCSCLSATGLKLCFDPQWPYEGSYVLDLWRFRWRRRPPTLSDVDVMSFIVAVEFSFVLWRKCESDLAPFCCFVFLLIHHENGEQALMCLRSKQFWMEDMLFAFETSRKETGLLLEIPRECEWEPVWALGISSKGQNTVRVQSFTTGERNWSLWSEMPWKKSCIVHSPTYFLFFWSCDSPTRFKDHWPRLASCPNCPHKSATLHSILLFSHYSLLSTWTQQAWKVLQLI